MAVQNQAITERYAAYHGDCIEVMASLPGGCIDLSVYSPPFCGLYHYSSDDRDLSNCAGSDDFFEHYGYVVADLARLTMPGRMTAVHCMDVPTGNSGKDALVDFPGDIIRLHADHGFDYIARYFAANDLFFGHGTGCAADEAFWLVWQMSGTPGDLAALPGVQAWIQDALAEHDFLDFEEPYRLGR